MNGREYLAHVHSLHCVVCLNCYGKWKPAQEAHHLEAYRGEHSDFAAVPLCKECHDLLHQMHRKAFYSLHNVDDVKLLSWTIQQLMEEQ